jgi:MFS family permease
MTTVTVSRRANRVAVACFFFIVGLSFASWASRIPDIKTQLNLNDAALGGILLALPAGSMASLPLSGWLVARFGSRLVLTIAAVCYPLMLIILGVAANAWQLVMVLFGFGLLGNMCNISVNTQAVGVEALYGRSIMASFHGIWSLAGFSGATIGTLMVSANIPTVYHFIIICIASLLLLVCVQRFTLDKDGTHPDQPIFARPDAGLLKLGLIAFSCMACEGTMFDWSGVYFQQVVEAPKDLVALGYAVFMGTMATGRFIGDRIVTRFGRKIVLQASGIVITIGLLTSVLFPTLVPATIGFFLVGFGVSSVIPLVYSSAGKSKTLSPGVALAAVSTIGFLGFLLGPPVIGFIAHASNLRWSFTLIALLGLGTTFLASSVGNREA